MQSVSFNLPGVLSCCPCISQSFIIRTTQSEYFTLGRDPWTAIKFEGTTCEEVHPGTEESLPDGEIFSYLDLDAWKVDWPTLAEHGAFAEMLSLQEPQSAEIECEFDEIECDADYEDNKLDGHFQWPIPNGITSSQKREALKRHFGKVDSGKIVALCEERVSKVRIKKALLSNTPHPPSHPTHMFDFLVRICIY